LNILKENNSILTGKTVNVSPKKAVHGQECIFHLTHKQLPNNKDEIQLGREKKKLDAPINQQQSPCQKKADS
jgi:hypothetical protein